MPNTKLSAMALLTGANVDVTNDRLLIYDVSATLDKAIIPAEFQLIPFAAAITIKKTEGVYIALQDAAGVAVAQLRALSAGGVGFGLNALGLNAGDGNVAFGANTLRIMTDGNHNVAIGDGSMYTAVHCVSNVSIGWAAMSNCDPNSTVQGNVAIGAQALNHINGNGNIAIGYQSLFNATAGEDNVCIGANTGLGVLTGSGNTVVGGEAGPTGDLTGTVCIGFESTVTGSFKAAIGNSTSGILQVGINMSNPTAWLHLPAGTATAGTAPLKLTAGTNLTVVENGAFEFNGTSLFFTVGGVRKTVTLV
jgi:hypothetical protein